MTILLDKAISSSRRTPQLTFKISRAQAPHDSLYPAQDQVIQIVTTSQEDGDRLELISRFITKNCLSHWATMS